MGHIDSWKRTLGDAEVREDLARRIASEGDSIVRRVAALEAPRAAARLASYLAGEEGRFILSELAKCVVRPSDMAASLRHFNSLAEFNDDGDPTGRALTLPRGILQMFHDRDDTTWFTLTGDGLVEYRIRAGWWGSQVLKGVPSTPTDFVNARVEYITDPARGTGTLLFHRADGSFRSWNHADWSLGTWNEWREAVEPNVRHHLDVSHMIASCFDRFVDVASKR